MLHIWPHCEHVKTNVIIFRNGGRIRSNENVYFNNEQIAETTYYKYLGIVFINTLLINSVKTLSSQVDKSIYSIKCINRECNGLSDQLLFDLFDKLVLPIYCKTQKFGDIQLERK